MLLNFSRIKQGRIKNSVKNKVYNLMILSTFNYKSVLLSTVAHFPYLWLLTYLTIVKFLLYELCFVCEIFSSWILLPASKGKVWKNIWKVRLFELFVLCILSSLYKYVYITWFIFTNWLIEMYNSEFINTSWCQCSYNPIPTSNSRLNKKKAVKILKTSVL